MSAFLIFPHQLFEQVSLLEEEYIFYLVESDLFFKQYAFHKQKILFHRASMQAFAARLRASGKIVEYIEAHDSRANEVQLVQSLRLSKITLFDPNDHLLERRIRRASPNSLIILASPNFLNSDVELLGNRKPYFQTSFYIQQRKERQILLEAEGKPMGGQWTFDAENRKKIPKNTFIPSPFPETQANEFVQEAIQYVEQYFPKNPGSSDMPFSGAYYPVTHEEAKAALDQFIRERIPFFGDFEDAMHTEEKFLFHSRLSFAMNSKMLSPKEVIEQVVHYYHQNEDQITLSQVEGFVRQILGWREYVRGIYWKEMPNYSSMNALENSNKLPDFYWTGKTKMNCLQKALSQSLEEAYAHHIQRLMIIGNFSLLTQMHPDEVDAWYLGVYIDAIEWVEMPNTRGMSQYADGGILATKPYVSSGSYINKMSNYCGSCHYSVKDKLGEKACPFNSLYWNFLDDKKEHFKNNQRMAMMLNLLNKIPAEEMYQIKKKAKEIMENLDVI